MSALHQLWEAIVGCSHRRLSLPITIRKSNGAGTPVGERETYRVCLECGRKFYYDWEEMSLVHPPKKRTPAAERVGAGLWRGRWLSRRA
ncbi:MAG: hypothetical protein HY648_04710 [Acidobacteria bacterium]|nr:hypothetical protein [Acidobacteriota bacterium]